MGGGASKFTQGFEQDLNENPLNKEEIENISKAARITQEAEAFQKLIRKIISNSDSLDHKDLEDCNEFDINSLHIDESPHCYCFINVEESFKLGLYIGSDKDIRNHGTIPGYLTPLMHSVLADNIRACELLLKDSRVNVNEKEDFSIHLTALHFAAMFGRYEIAEQLLQKEGIDLDAKTNQDLIVFYRDLCSPCYRQIQTSLSEKLPTITEELDYDSLFRIPLETDSLYEWEFELDDGGQQDEEFENIMRKGFMIPAGSKALDIIEKTLNFFLAHDETHQGYREESDQVVFDIRNLNDDFLRNICKIGNRIKEFSLNRQEGGRENSSLVAHASATRVLGQPSITSTQTK